MPTFRELGYNWVDGAYRGIGVPKSTPPAVRKQVSDMMDVLNKDPEMRKKMFEGGFEVTDITRRDDAGVHEGAHAGVHELGEDPGSGQVAP